MPLLEYDYSIMDMYRDVNGNPIEQNFITKNEFSRVGKRLGTITGIIVHWVANPGSSALATRNYFEGLKNQKKGDDRDDRYAGTQLVVGLEGEVIQMMPYEEVAYHVGARLYMPGIQKKLGNWPNGHTIGIEVCHPDWSGKFKDKTYWSLVDLVGHLLACFNLKEKDVYRHYDVTGKTCPRYFVDNPLKWDEFLFDLQAGIPIL